MAGDETIDTEGRHADLEPTQPEGARVVLLLNAKEESMVVDLGQKGALTVGRGAGADIRLGDRTLSRRHARFEYSGDTVKVTDLGSRHGTLVMGKRVLDAELGAGDTAVLGNVMVSVQLVGSPGAALLGLSTLAQMRARVETEWARASRFRRPFSVVLLRASRKVGVGVFARACLTKLRPSDQAGLYDPSSLLLLLPETDAIAAETLTRELLLAAAEVTLMAGIAAYPESAFTPDQLLSAAVHAVMQGTPSEQVVVACGSPPVRASQRAVLVRCSPAMLELDRLIDRFAMRSAPVLVLGETGTGKELVAREIHQRSARRGQPLRVVNCAAIPDSLVESVLFGHVRGAFTGADRQQAGVFERAKGGSIFLDEVGELSPSAQAALLRAVETQRICPVGGTREIELDVRVISATHRRLEAMVEIGGFREDLYHRLNTLTLHLPPLRDRPEEIAPLIQAFLQEVGSDSNPSARRIAPDALALLERHPWPGNVRELKNVIERALALAESDEITAADLPDHVRDPRAPADAPTVAPGGGRTFPAGGLDLRTHVQQHEARLIKSALECANGRQRRAAELLNLPLRTFERKLRELGERSSNDA